MPIPLLLHGRHADASVTYEPFGPWIVPWRFTTAESEYRALQQGVGLIDFSTQATIDVRGADRTGFLHRLLTNDIARLSPGQGCQAALLTPAAKLVGTCLVLAAVDATRLICDLPQAQAMVQTLDHYLFSEQVTLTNHERHFGVLGVQGPRAFELLTRISGAALPLPAAGSHAPLRLHGLSLTVVRHSLTGGPGLLCLVGGQDTEAVWRLLLQEGRASGLTPIGWEALNLARIEAGIPWFGIDMDASNLLPETGLERTAVSDSKGCYLGQEIIARMRTYGAANKRLMGVQVAGDRVPAPGSRLQRAGEEVGWLTSSGWSPALHQPIAMGYVKRGAYEPGTAVEVLHDGERLPARVVDRPLVPHPDAPAVP